MCAAPLADQLSAQQLEAQERLLPAQRKRMTAMCDGSAAAWSEIVVVEPEIGYDDWSQMCDPDLQSADPEDASASRFAFGINNPGLATSPTATTLASQLLLKLRIDRLNTKP